MIIVNFVLFMLCMFTFIGFLITFVFGAWWLSLFFFILFCLMYYAFRMDHKRMEQPKEIILTYRNGDLQKEVKEDDDLPYFDRNNFNFN